MRSMGWVVAYGVTNAAFPVVGKLVIRSNSLTAWGRTYYNNLMTFLVFVPVALVVGDVGRLGTLQAEGAIHFAALGMLMLSCVWGTAISFLGFLVREASSLSKHSLSPPAPCEIGNLKGGERDTHAILRSSLFPLSASPAPLSTRRSR